METTSKTVIEIPYHDFLELKENQKQILKGLQNLSAIETPEYLTVKEFTTKCKMGRWKFDQLRDSGKLNVIRRGKKLYIPFPEVHRYFQGEME